MGWRMPLSPASRTPHRDCTIKLMRSHQEGKGRNMAGGLRSALAKRSRTKEMGLGAVRHREALLVFASAWDRVPTLAKLSLDFSSSMSGPYHAWPRRFRIPRHFELSAV